MSLTLRKSYIDTYLKNFDENNKNVEFIYGGITENSLKQRRNEHIQKKQIKEFDETWIISEKPITTIRILDANKLEYYKKLVADVEQYLINKLNEKYKKQCKNDRNNNGGIAQQGGKGGQINLNDSIKFYIFYKLK